jgi:Tfp pilus assembly protein PilO
VRISNERSTNNMFFDQKAYRLTVTTDDESLISFLVSVGSGESMVRVHDLDLKPKPPYNSQLTCNMTLVANYQKQPSEE